MKKSIHAFGVPLILAAGAPAVAAPAGLAQLLGQAKYWQGKGRADLARQAYNRALAIDPANTEARSALANGMAAPQPAPPAKTAHKTPAPAPMASSAPAPRRQPAVAGRATPSAPARAATDRGVERSVDRGAQRGGDARAAGFRALDAGQLDLAATRFRTALSANPSDADALGGLGIVRLRGSRFAEARDLLVKASGLGAPAKWREALDAARFYAGMDTARAALAAGKVDQAQQIAQALASSGFADRNSATALLASIYERQGRHGEAADLYRQLGQDGASAAGGAAATVNALRNQALAAVDSGDDVGAERLLREGMAVAPSDPWIAYDLASLLIRQQRLSESDALVRSLAYSDDPQPLYAAALILNRSGRTADASAVMARIAPGRRTQEMRDFVSGLDVLGTIRQAKALAARGAQGQALSNLRQAADVRGLSIDRMGSLAQAMLDLGDMAGAAQIARNALNARADDAASYDPVVRVLTGTGQDGLAMEAVRKASALAGDSLSGQRSIAGLSATLAVAQADRLRQMGQFAPAFDTLQAAWQSAPGNVAILTALARLYQSGGMNGQAVQAFRMALAEQPDDKAMMIGLIDTATATGDFRTARATAVQAVRAHPQDHEVYMAASRMEQARGDFGKAVKYLKTARALYMQRAGGGTGLTGGNPFAAGPVAAGSVAVGSVAGGQPDANPFRSGAAPIQAQPANPFAFGARPVQDATPLYRPQSRPDVQAMPRYSPTAYADPLPGPAMARTAQDYGSYPVAATAAGFSGGTTGPGIGTTGAPASDFGDPVLAAIDRGLQDAAMDDGPRVDVDTGYRSRTGETGLSQLQEISGGAKISTALAGGRVGLSARAVSVDAGRPTGSGLARFGTNATAEAQGIVARQPSQLVQADTQHASGVGLSGSYESDLLKLEVGTTPLGFAKSHIAGRAEISPRLSAHSTARVWLSREAVTDSIASYAGTIDPRTGAFWGAVMKSGGGVSLSYDRDGNGVYADASYSHYDGTAVRDNRGVQVNVGGYLRAWQNDDSGLSVGFNANFQNYDNNQNYFTYGHGGYFSPQSFISVNFPVRYWMKKGPLAVNASVAPGYQSYDQQSEGVYPNDAGAQGILDYLKDRNSDVRSRYDSASKTGFGMSAAASAYYTLTPGTRIGGDLTFNSFGAYKEFKTSLGIRQQIGSR